MEIIPVGKKILLKKVEAETNVGGIYVPQSSAEERCKIYEVKTISEAAKIVTLNNVPTTNIVEGDKVIVKNFIGVVVTEGKDEFLIVDKEDIVAIIR